MSNNKKCLFIFRRDLRLTDNTGLIEAGKRYETIIPCFIVDPRQVQAHPFRSLPALQFMLDSLKGLERQLAERGGKLSLFYGHPEIIIKDLLLVQGIDAVAVNTDYTPFSRKRDEKLRRLCRSCGVAFHSRHDLLLTTPGEALKKDGTPYTVFTPFFKKASGLKVSRPGKMPAVKFLKRSLGEPAEKIYGKLQNAAQPAVTIPPGRSGALRILKGLADYKNYGEERNLPVLAATTHLSVHLKFGTCSVREAYYGIRKKLGIHHDLIRQLYWRDFYTHIAWHFPHVFGHAFKKRYDELHWNNNRKVFKAWCRGRTGFPIVDAGMRQLNQTGFMHNRVRMITASFLIKDLHIDWRWGERYFATKLVDYDPCVNNGNWQWAASTGCDAQPWFRIFNPWRQQKKFDGDCDYIHRWLPELGDALPEAIHGLNAGKIISGYPAPIVDHDIEVEITKKLYKNI